MTQILHSQADQTVLSVSGLEISFLSGDKVTTAVNGVSYSLKKGETLGIVGESGSGKSVSTMALLQLIPTPPGKINHGEAIYENEVNLLALGENEIRHYRGKEIAMIFQEPMTSLNPSQKCGKQVGEMLEIHTDWDKGKIKDYVLHLFGQVKLPQPERIYKSYPHQLSGGQLQRVMIAMAITCKPKILIADEPTTALDVTVQKSIIHLLQELNQANNNSAIFITHDLGVIYDIADQVLVMYKGEIVEYGPVEEVFFHPKHPYTKGLLACRPPMDMRYKRLPVVEDFLTMPPSEYQTYIDSLVQTNEEYRSHLDKVMTHPVLLECKNVKKYYPTSKNFWGVPRSYVKAVDDVSFVLRKGECLGLVGESGCGKSTLGRVIMRLDTLTGGKVIFEGMDVHGLPDKKLRLLRRDFQIIFQDPYSSLNPRMTVGQAIIEPLNIHGLYENKKVRKEKVIELLEKVGMKADHYDRYPHQFSGGQRQRICIARALTLEPKFILCDESVSALDVSVQAQVLNLLQDLKEEYGLSYLFISHDLSVVKFISDRILVMKQGKIVESGEVEEVIHNPQTDYTRLLINSIPGKGRKK